MSASGTIETGADDAGRQLLVLEYNGVETLVPRPKTYQDLLSSLPRYLPNIPKHHDEFVFETNELEASRGKWAVISEDTWATAAPLVNKIRVSSSACKKSSTWRFPFSLCGGGVRLKWWKGGVDRCEILVENTGTGKTFTIRCSCFDTIARVKALVKSQEGIKLRAQILSYEGVELEDALTLADYGIQTGVTIQLAVRVLLRAKKPVIYLYPPIATRVTAKLTLRSEWKFSAIYPIVPVKDTPHGEEIEWTVDALPCGTLKEVNTGLEVSYLYWEAEEEFNPSRPNLTTSNSVLLEIDKITPYLDSLLRSLGLHVEARTSFITYWLPSLLKHKYVALRFLPQPVYERAAPLHFEPVPNVILRIFMVFRSVDENDLGLWGEASMKANSPVELWRTVIGAPDVERLQDANLFRVIEWGGMEVC